MRPECSQNNPNALGGDGKGAFVRQTHLCGHAGNEALETEDIEHAGEVVAKRHQAPFAANLVEAAKEEVPIAGAAFDCAERMLDKPGATAHQLACALHPGAMTFENILVLPASDGAVGCLRSETTGP